MGKYMRRKRGRAADGDGEAAPAAVVLGGGVRTRSRSAAVVAGANPAKRRKQAEAATTATGSVEEAGCYLHLRSRRLFMPVAVAARGDLGVEEASTSRLANSSAPSGEAIAAGISRCSSAASSAAARERSDGEAEACESRDDVETSVSDSECGARVWRETTPSSQPPVDDYISDLESSQATDEQTHSKRCSRTRATTTTTNTTAFHLQPRARMPAAAEIEQFFAAAEKAEAERFAAKYNFDVALGLPLDAGRFEWTPVAAV
ncbi:cyclin-dependent kinase inhibitor 1-like [Lolium rigidum]|uniref:cyclin-dependent kinase inhibitor 1-like n=1 Tax=Lolium rigidum TaxID=89674 RepID=UPI001F5D8BBB|nr:cyclin-dependent kinase inhibitor 1-like [Lolium rigidum]